MRLEIHKANLAIVIAVFFSACLPIASQDRVLAGRSEPAERVTVVEGGGHFPVACILKNGELAVVLRGGAPHIGIKGRLDLVTSNDSGRTWSAPRTIVDTPFDDRNPAFGQLSDGALVMAYVVETADFDESGLREKNATTDGVYVIRSTDAGSTWTSPYNGCSPLRQSELSGLIALVS